MPHNLEPISCVICLKKSEAVQGFLIHKDCICADFLYMKSWLWSHRLMRSILFVCVLVYFANISSDVLLADTAITGLWANEGGDKVTRDELRATLGRENLTGHVLNSTWNGSRIKLTGAHNEEVSFNLVLEAGGIAAARGVSVIFDTLTGPNGIQIHSIPATGNGVFDWTQRPIELFYLRYVPIKGLSYFGYPKWDERQVPLRFQRPYVGPGAGIGGWTDRPDHDKFYPDAMVPLEAVPSFDIPMGTNQSIWADVYIPRNIPSGTYQGSVSIRENGNATHTVPITLDVQPFTLPDNPSAKTMVNLDTTDIEWRYVTGAGGYANWQSSDGKRIAAITDRYYQLFHRHKLSLIGENECPANDKPCDTSLPRLTGTLYTGNFGYDGPGVNTPEGVFSIGTYGTWGAATYGVPAWKYDKNLFWQHTNNYAAWFQQNLPNAEAFLYLEDEPPPQDYATVNTWAQWIKQNPGAGQSLSSFVTHPFTKAAIDMPDVDIPVMPAGVGICPSEPCDNITLNETWADFYRTAPRRKLWMYNDGRPGTGTFMTEDDGIGPRMIPWAQYKKQIDRWFYWYANVLTPRDWFQDPVSWGDNQYFDPVVGLTGNNGTSNGNGLLVYPGTTVYGGQTSYGLDGPIASLRIKEWRRGIQDVDYIALASKYDPVATAQVVASTVPKVLWEYNAPNPSSYVGQGPTWSSDPDAWEQARNQLNQIILVHCNSSAAIAETNTPCDPGSIGTSTPTDPSISSTGSQSGTTNTGQSSDAGAGQQQSTSAAAMVFVPISPCRLMDTRGAVSDLGGPYLAARTGRTIPILTSACNVPSSAQAYAINVTVVPHGILNFLTIYPAGLQLPNVSLLNSPDGKVKASGAIIPAGVAGSLTVFGTDDTDLVIDITGYFVLKNVANGLQYFPIVPCRILDTRLEDVSVGGPLKAGTQRTVALLGSSCGVPSNARAYSLNYTALPASRLNWLTAWPAGEQMPTTSILNAPTGAVTANASITPAGVNGSISVFVTDQTNLIVDIDGYFAEAASGGLSLYNANPCRAFDSRLSNSPSPKWDSMSIDFVQSGCGIPSTAAAVVTNVTVVPLTKLEFLSLGPTGRDITDSSTLNSYDGQITSNLAIIPTSNGSIAAFTSDRTHVLFDVAGYFAP